MIMSEYMQELFNYMVQDHNVTLLEQDMHEIESIVGKHQEAKIATLESKLSALQGELAEAKKKSEYLEIPLFLRNPEGLQDDIKAEFERLQAKLAEREWVSVTDRLPEPGTLCLAYRPTAPETNDNVLLLQTYHGGEYWNVSWQGVKHQWSNICHPTHWKPLPAFPTDERK